MIQQIQTVYMPTHDWKLPFNIAIGLHLLIVVGSIYLPGLFEAKPKFADIYTVSLINIVEPVTPPQLVESTQTVPPRVIEKNIQAKKIAPIAEKTEKTSPAPVKAISLKPYKRKKIKKINRINNSSRRKEIDRRKRQQLANALKEEELLAENARIAQEALVNERNLLKPSKRPPLKNESTSSPVKNSSTGPRITGSSDLISSRYQSAIASRLLQFWSLPEFMQKNRQLTAVVGITIAKDGTIANMVFEKKSGNRVFDQFVRKTIENANPLPAIPPAMKKQRYEIGLIFRPGSIN